MQLFGSRCQRDVRELRRKHNHWTYRRLPRRWRAVKKKEECFASRDSWRWYRDANWNVWRSKRLLCAFRWSRAIPANHEAIKKSPNGTTAVKTKVFPKWPSLWLTRASGERKKKSTRRHERNWNWFRVLAAKVLRGEMHPHMCSIIVIKTIKMLIRILCNVFAKLLVAGSRGSISPAHTKTARNVECGSWNKIRRCWLWITTQDDSSQLLDDALRLYIKKRSQANDVSPKTISPGELGRLSATRTPRLATSSY